MPTATSAPRYPELAATLARRGLTLADLARSIYYSPATLSKVLRGHLEPSHRLKNLIGEALDESVELLFAEPNAAPMSTLAGRRGRASLQLIPGGRAPDPAWNGCETLKGRTDSIARLREAGEHGAADREQQRLDQMIARCQTITGGPCDCAHGIDR